MRTIGLNLMGIIGLMVTLTLFIGCSGSGDVLGDLATRNSASASPQNDGTNTTEIDVVQGLCDGEPEAFFPFDASVVIETSETSAQFRVESYTVGFRPNHGAYLPPGGSWTDIPAAGMPDLSGTELSPVNYQSRSIVIEANSTTTLGGLLVWSHGDKGVYRATILDASSLYNNSSFVYDMQVVLRCKDLEGNSFNITTPWTPVVFDNFDGCSSS